MKVDSPGFPRVKNGCAKITKAMENLHLRVGIASRVAQRPELPLYPPAKDLLRKPPISRARPARPAGVARIHRIFGKANGRGGSRNPRRGRGSRSSDRRGWRCLHSRRGSRNWPRTGRRIDYLKLLEEGDASLESLGAQGQSTNLRPKVPDQTLNVGLQGATLAHSRSRYNEDPRVTVRAWTRTNRTQPCLRRNSKSRRGPNNRPRHTPAKREGRSNELGSSKREEGTSKSGGRGQWKCARRGDDGLNPGHPQQLRKHLEPQASQATPSPCRC